MNINRHNYEEYFILYMDNELSVDERRMVEDFVQVHPDLKEELDLLLHYRVEPDTSVVFNGKEELMKVNGETPISLSNYEEWLILYTDNELSTAQRISVEQFAAANPAVKEELAQMMRAKLQPEEIVFPYKESLYRKEERRIAPRPTGSSGRVFRWRIAAAAILIIAVGITSILVLNKKSAGVIKGDVAKTESAPKGQNSSVVNDQQTNTTSPVLVEEIADRSTNQAVVTDPVKQTSNPSIKPENKNATALKKDRPADNNNAPVNNSPAINNITNKEKETFATTNGNDPTNNLPEPENNPNIKRAVPADALADNNDKIQKVLTDKPVTITPAPPSELKDDAYVTARLEEGSDNKKSRGLFRKIARTFEKRTNLPATDDNRLLVAGLSFKLK